MATSVTNNNIDTSELDKKEKEAQQQITLLQSQISQLESQNQTLLKQIATAGIEEAARLRQQYNAYQNKISQLKGELSTWQKNLADIQQAKSEASHDNDVQTDDYYRIPAIMQDCKVAYNLTWQGEGHWNGWTYEREATMPNIKGTIYFKAKVSLVRKPKYFLGIKIHRAIIGISWELTANYTDTQVVRVVELDPSMEDKEKEKIVNQAISEVARAYPSCKVTTEYIKSEPMGEDESGEAYHLLWASDRIEIARQIETRMSHIYVDLVSLEKMMHYKLSILDVCDDMVPI
jgi:prefoldin subunit 5